MDQMQIINTGQVAQQKYQLEKTIEEKMELRIFFMGVTDNATILPSIHRLAGIIAYRHSDATIRAQQIWGRPGNMVFGRPEDSETIKNLLQNVDLEGAVVNNTVTHEKLLEESVMPIERFKASLIMAVAEYVKNDQDRAELRRIISTINVPEKV